MTAKEATHDPAAHATAGRKPEVFNTSVFPTWCPGCGNFGIWGAVKQALVDLEIEPHDMFYVWGIGCHGNGADFLKVFGFHALHGRALPVATAARLANHSLKVIVEMGDGDGYGIGGNHFLHTCRRNVDLAVIGHNNQVYGLTTGQTSPTSEHHYASPSTPHGAIEEPVNPLALALTEGATFVARGFSGDIPHLTGLVKAAIEHRGFALLDVFQPCVTFNKKNPYGWFRERVVKLEETGHDPSDKMAALAAAMGADGEERLPIGVFYREERPTYEDELGALTAGPLAHQPLGGRDLGPLIAKYR